jgi:ATP-dependent DNA ligase
LTDAALTQSCAVDHGYYSRAGIQYVEHSEGDGAEMYKAVCKLGLEGIVSKKLDAPYRSGPSKAWLKIKNPKAPAATRAADGTF